MAFSPRSRDHLDPAGCQLYPPCHPPPQTPTQVHGSASNFFQQNPGFLRNPPKPPQIHLRVPPPHLSRGTFWLHSPDVWTCFPKICLPTHFCIIYLFTLWIVFPPPALSRPLFSLTLPLAPRLIALRSRQAPVVPDDHRPTAAHPHGARRPAYGGAGSPRFGW